MANKFVNATKHFYSHRFCRRRRQPSSPFISLLLIRFFFSPFLCIFDPQIIIYISSDTWHHLFFFQQERTGKETKILAKQEARTIATIIFFGWDSYLLLPFSLSHSVDLYFLHENATVQQRTIRRDALPFSPMAHSPVYSLSNLLSFFLAIGNGKEKESTKTAPGWVGKKTKLRLPKRLRRNRPNEWRMQIRFFFALSITFLFLFYKIAPVKLENVGHHLMCVCVLGGWRGKIERLEFFVKERVKVRWRGKGEKSMEEIKWRKERWRERRIAEDI